MNRKRRPRTGERRRWRRPLKADLLPAEARTFVQDARAGRCVCAKRAAHFHTWMELEELSPQFAGQKISHSALHRWYDIRIEQVEREVLGQAETARHLAAAFAAKGVAKLPEATLNALSAQVFEVLRSGTPAEREISLRKFLEAQAEMVKAQAQRLRAEAEQRKATLAEKKFAVLRSRADKETNEAAAKLGKGRTLTLDDINRIRERALGLPPIER